MVIGSWKRLRVQAKTMCPSNKSELNVYQNWDGGGISDLTKRCLCRMASVWATGWVNALGRLSFRSTFIFLMSKNEYKTISLTKQLRSHYRGRGGMRMFVVFYKMIFAQRIFRHNRLNIYLFKKVVYEKVKK